MNSRQAACSCGQLSLTTRGEPIRISVCHCLECQRRTGSIFGAQARFSRDNVEILGQSSRYHRVADSGHEITFHFCPMCGATVFYLPEAEPDTIAVPVGVFADPAFPAPRVSVYESRKHPWARVPEGVEHFD